MKDGHWLVSVEERPKGWERYGLAEPEKHADDAVPADVKDSAKLLEEIVEHGTVEPSEEAAEPEKPLRKRRKHVTETSRWVSYQSWHVRELAEALRNSGEAFGASPEMVTAAAILLAGMFVRRPALFRDYFNIPIGDAVMIKDRYERTGVWNANGKAVYLGEALEDSGDMELWMLAMVGTGEMCCQWNADRTSMLYSTACPKVNK